MDDVRPHRRRPALRRLSVGKGYIDNVPPEVWSYEVSGKNVLRQWFSYRRKNRERPLIGSRRPPSGLNDIRPDRWLPEYTTDLINLLHVLGGLVALEPVQAELLEEICEGPLIPADELGVLDTAAGGGKRRGRDADPNQVSLLE